MNWGFRVRGFIPTAKRCRAFSIIELLVVIGLIAVLVSLLLPSVHKAKNRAKAVTALQVMGSNSTLILAYQMDYREYFPISPRATHPVWVGYDFHHPLRLAGLINTVTEVDPWYGDSKRRTVEMSYSLATDPRLTIPGQTIPIKLLTVFPIRLSDVSFPSNKGQVARGIAEDAAGITGEGYWCCYNGAPKSQVAFCDGSAGEYYWHELLPDGRYYRENGIGGPVFSTWYGCKGIDKGTR